MTKKRASKIKVTSHLKRHRATKEEMEKSRTDLYEIVKAIKPMTVRQVFYQATVRSLLKKVEYSYDKVQTALADMRKAGKLPFLWIGEKIEQTLREMAPNAEIHFQRLAVTPVQIIEWNLPTRPTKKTDSRAKKFGEISVELDSIEPNMLRGLVENAILQHLPADEFKVLKAAEESERDLIACLVDDMRQVMGEYDGY